MSKRPNLDPAIAAEGSLVALEILVVALAQRLPGGDKAVAAALIMLDAVGADLLDHDNLQEARRQAKVLAVARSQIAKVAREVIAFRDGDGVQEVG